MDWFRYHHGTQNDPKLSMIAKKAGVRRCEMTAVWDELMDYASRHVTRGHVTGCDLEVIAFVQEIELDDVKKIYAALEEKGLIVNGRLSNWEKRQPEKEDEGATDRKRKQRQREKEKREAEERRKNEEKVTNDVTPCHAMSHDVTTDKKRLEEIRLEEMRGVINPNPKSPNKKTPIPKPLSSNGVLKNGNLGWDVVPRLSEIGLDRAKQNAPNWDVYHLAKIYNEGIACGKREPPNKPDAAFAAWCKVYTKGKPPN